MSKYVTKDQLLSLLNGLDLAEGLIFYDNIKEVIINKTDNARALEDLDDTIERLDRDDDRINEKVTNLNESFGLLLDYLDLELQTGKRIVKKKKGKK